MKVLMVCKYYQPDIAIAAVRPTKFAKYLSMGGHQVDLLTTTDNVGGEYLGQVYYMPQQSSWLRKTLDGVLGKRRSKENSVSSTGSGKPNKIKAFIKRCLYKALAYLSFLAELGTSKKQYKYFKQNIAKTIDFSGYDVVFSTFSPLFSHYIAKSIKKQNNSLVWIADFRDPVLGAAVPKIFKHRTKRIVEGITSRADIVTMVSDDGSQAYQFSKDANVRVLNNGFDRDDYAFEVSPLDDRLNLCYAGSFYQDKSSLLRVFQAVKNLIEQGKVDKDKVKIHYLGRQPHYCYDWAIKTGLEEQLEDHGVVSKDESLRFCMQCDVNLVTIWNNKDSQGIISGKAYELFAMGKPIIAEITGDLPNSELKRMIDATQTGYCYEEATCHGDVSGIEEYILRQYQDKMQGKTLSVGNAQEIAKYDYRNLTERLIATIREYKQNANQE